MNKKVYLYKALFSSKDKINFVADSIKVACLTFMFTKSTLREWASDVTVVTIQADCLYYF